MLDLEDSSAAKELIIKLSGEPTIEDSLMTMSTDGEVIDVPMYSYLEIGLTRCTVLMLAWSCLLS